MRLRCRTRANLINSRSDERLDANKELDEASNLFTQGVMWSLSLIFDWVKWRIVVRTSERGSSSASLAFGELAKKNTLFPVGNWLVYSIEDRHVQHFQLQIVLKLLAQGVHLFVHIFDVLQHVVVQVLQLAVHVAQLIQNGPNFEVDVQEHRGAAAPNFRRLARVDTLRPVGWSAGMTRAGERQAVSQLERLIRQGAWQVLLDERREVLLAAPPLDAHVPVSPLGDQFVDAQHQALRQASVARVVRPDTELEVVPRRAEQGAALQDVHEVVGDLPQQPREEDALEAGDQLCLPRESVEASRVLQPLDVANGQSDQQIRQNDRHQNHEGEEHEMRRSGELNRNCFVIENVLELQFAGHHRNRFQERPRDTLKGLVRVEQDAEAEPERNQQARVGEQELCEVHGDFREHLNVEAEDGEPADDHHQLQPNEEDDNGCHVVLPLGNVYQVAGQQCARRLWKIKIIH